MSSGRALPFAIQWHEGMLLAPQHFQQANLRQEALVHHRTANLYPYYWGFRNLQVDDERLTEKIFRVKSLDAIMPDGLVASHGSDDDDLSLDLKPYEEQIQRHPTLIHLAVTGRVSGLSSVAGAQARYVSVEGEPVVDANTGGGEVAIPRLRPMLRLLIADEVPKKYVSIPIARLTFGEKGLARSEDFEPPRLQVIPREPLAEQCRWVIQQLRAEGKRLVDTVRSDVMANHASQLIATQALVRSLVAPLPRLQALHDCGVARPFEVYLAMCEVLGNLAAMGRSRVPAELRPYDHDDPLAAFREVRQAIQGILDEELSKVFTGFPFRWDRQAFNLYFEEAWLEEPTASSLVLGVRARPEISPEATAQWVRKCAIASESQMERMRHQRIRGLERLRIEGETELVPAQGVTLYRLKVDRRYIAGGEVLQIRNLDDPGHRMRPVEIVLYVRNQP